MFSIPLLFLACHSEKDTDTATEIASSIEDTASSAHSEADLSEDLEDSGSNTEDSNTEDSNETTSEERTSEEDNSSQTESSERDSSQAERTEDTQAPDSEDTPSGDSCSVDDLIWEAAIEDSSGAQTLSTASTLLLIGRITNPCSNSISLTTPSSCLVSGGLLFGPNTHLWNNTCSFVLTDWLIPGMSSIQQEEPFASPSSGFYELQIYFADTEAHNGLLTFTVSP